MATSPRVDNRGSFARLFCCRDLSPSLEGRSIHQINHSITAKAGAIRGLHYQLPPMAEMKLVRCIRGRVWDVAVDLRDNSPTFLEWHAEEISAENAKMVIIPEGCAHGFQSLTEGAELLYLHTAPYTPELEGGLAYNDPALGITWPVEVSDISQRDSRHPQLNPSFKGIKL